MAMAMMSWLIAIPLLGFANGMRTMTPMAVLCWFAYTGALPVAGTWAFWTAKPAAAIVFTVLAVGEFIGDKLPKTPNRIAPGPLVARIFFGGFVSLIVAITLNGSGSEGVILGVAGVLVGAFASFVVRRDLVARVGGKDWPLALLEDFSAVLFAIFAMGVVTG